MYLVGVSDTTNSVDALMDARDVVEASTLDVRPIAYSGTFAFTEQVRTPFSIPPLRATLGHHLFVIIPHD